MESQRHGFTQNLISCIEYNILPVLVDFCDNNVSCGDSYSYILCRHQSMYPNF